MAVMSTILSRLASAPVHGLYETVVRQSLSPLCEAIGKTEGDDKWIAAAALEQLSGLLQGAPEGNIGSGFIDTLAPALFACLRTTKDRDAIQVRLSTTITCRHQLMCCVVWYHLPNSYRTQRLRTASSMERCFIRKVRHRLCFGTYCLAAPDGRRIRKLVHW